ncbi:MAG: hypothetical protein LBU94_04735, partial [Clostridiales bacterium]|nr:hypothetical protein [Clostridiales bacterium]
MPVAFDIGFEHLKIVWAAVKKGRVLVKKSESIKLPAEFSSLSEKEQADIIQALAKPVINDNKIKGNCYITLNDSRFLIRHVQIPHSRPNEIRAMAFNEMALLYGAKEDDMLCLYN